MELSVGVTCFGELLAGFELALATQVSRVQRAKAYEKALADRRVLVLLGHSRYQVKSLGAERHRKFPLPPLGVQSVLDHWTYS